MSADVGKVPGAAEGLICPRLERAESFTLSHGDVLDVKASIGLVVIAFLAEQSLATTTNVSELWLWRISAVTLAVAAVLAVAELWPRDYDIDEPDGWMGWLDELRTFHKDADDVETNVCGAVTSRYIQQLQQRIVKNRAVNRQKERLLVLSFAFVAPALACNLAIGLSRWFG